MASASDSDKPSVSNVEANRSRLCDEFAAVTGTDIAAAQGYLAENDWEMEVQLLSEASEMGYYITRLLLQLDAEWNSWWKRCGPV